MASASRLWTCWLASIIGWLVFAGLSPSLPARAQAPAGAEPLPMPAPVPPPASIVGGGNACVLPMPVVSEGRGVSLPPGQLDPADKPLPINLATALRLSGARPIIIQTAEAGLEIAGAQLAKAKVLWLPSVYTGLGYYRHDGATQGQSGNFYINSKDQLMVGGGVVASFAATDALFGPLAARQIVRARQLDLQTARNEALFTTAQAYFSVLTARGRLAGAQDVVAKGNVLSEKVKGMKLGRVAPADIDRARALDINYQEAVETAREAWRIASADLAQVLRLDPTVVVIPVEPPQLRVTLISSQASLDSLVPIGLTNRPELASQQALVQAALARIRQERMRPLIPSLILQGTPGSVGPGGYFEAGLFASGVHGEGNPTGIRDDVSAALVWGLDNMGFGNRALVRQRRAEQYQLLVDLFRIQDQVAGDIVRAHAQLVSADRRVGQSEEELREAEKAYDGSMQHLGEVVSVGDAKLVVNRTLDVISSIQALARAYDNYFGSIGDYNTAQFRLYRGLGFTANMIAGHPALGMEQPIDTNRPLPMTPAADR
jgi:outer membrane protein TolC